MASSDDRQADRDRELGRLLELAAGRVDLEQQGGVDRRYLAAFRHEEVDPPPLVVSSASIYGSADVLPAPWNAFRYYSYADAFADPVAMLQNQILDRVVPGLLLRDDSPLAVRNNHGTIQIASILGGRWGMYEGAYPWVRHVDTLEDIERIASDTRPVSPQDGVLPLSFRTLRFYREALGAHPPLDRAVQISLPDLQGPMDTAEQLWGSSIYYQFYDNPALLGRLLHRIVDVMLAVAGWYRELATDRLHPEAVTQHGWVVPGTLLTRNDSSIPLSPSLYREHVKPHDARLAGALGTSSFHSCGRWDHLVEDALDLPGVRGLDLGNPEMMDLAGVARKARSRGATLLGLLPTREELVSGAAARAHPTGVVFGYAASSFEEARHVTAGYYRRRGPA